MIAPTVVGIPERGTAEVSANIWKEMARSNGFWTLVERGVVSVEHLPAGRVRLAGGCYVGRSSISDQLILELHEKVAGSLESLLAFASGSDFRVERVRAPSSPLGSLIALLIGHFADAVQGYMARGRQFEYRRRAMRGSLIGGRLDVTRTLRLRARGLHHLAAFEKDTVTYDLPINRCVLSALREVEHIARVLGLPSQLLARTRAMEIPFEDCRSVDTRAQRRGETADRAEKLSAATRDKLVADMLALAAIILSHESFEHGSEPAGTAPRSWFLNLENLFERAVRQTMKAGLAGRGEVSSGRAAPPPIFAARADMFRANPDLVVRLHNPGNTLIGDVKYKRWDGVASASDTYQLLVHAAAFDSRDAFLVFPFDHFVARDLGYAVTGARVRLFGVAINQLDSHVRRLLEHLGLVAPDADAVLAASHAS